MRIEPNQKLLFIGDSITHCQRSEGGELSPWDPWAGLGRGYVQQIDVLLNNLKPGLAARVINRGIGGNTVRDLAARWEQDVFALEPDWVSVMVGTNDVWRQFDVPLQREKGVPIEEYDQSLRDLVARTLPRVRGLVLCTPFVIEGSLQDPFRQRMDRYSAVVRTIAAQQQLPLVDTQAAVDRLLDHWHATALAWDRIHGNASVHMAIALAWLKAVGCAIGG
jgi:lysophospholipase L1-like esterase